MAASESGVRKKTRVARTAQAWHSSMRCSAVAWRVARIELLALSLLAPPHFDRAVWREMLRWRVAERGGERSSGAVRAPGGAPPSFAAEVCALLHGAAPRP